MKSFKCAIVGCGSIGKRHVAVLEADPNMEIIGICDIDEEKCVELSQAYGNVPYFTDYTTMLDSIDADIIHVVTPHALHAPMTIEACKKNFSVVVEKPMALTSSDCHAMNEAAERNNVNLWVVKQNRYNVPVVYAKDAIDKGMLGNILMVKCDILWNRYQGYYDDSPWRGKLAEEGGALYTQASHFIDLLVWWCGDVVAARGSVETQNHNIETEDSGIASLKFANGAMGSLVWTTCVYNKNFEGSVTIIGEKGTIKIGGKYLNLIEYWDVESYPLQEGIDYTDKPNKYSKYQGTSSNHDKVITAIVNQLNNMGDQTVSGYEGLKTVSAIEKIYAGLAKV